MKKYTSFLAGLLALAVTACGGSEETARAGNTATTRQTPAAPAVAASSEIQTLRSELDRYPEYSVVLAGLKNEMAPEGPGGNTVPVYAHQYRLVWLDADKKPGARTTEWSRIPKDQYDREQRISGQAVVRKLANGQIDTIPTPPALAYVGNPQYGSWERDNQGQNYWAPAATYMQYMLMAQVIDEIGDARRRNGRVYRSEYDQYRTNPTAYRTRYSDSYRTAYTKTYGAKGAPATFNDRVRSTTASGNASFNDRVKSEVRGTGAIPATPATPASATAARGRATPATPATPARAATAAPAASSSNGSYRPGRPAATAAAPTYTPPRPSAPKPSYRPSSSGSSNGSWRPSSGSSSRSSGRRSSGRRRH